MSKHTNKKRYTVWWMRILLGGFCCVIAALVLRMLIEGGETAFMIVGWASLVVLLVGAVFGFRSATVAISDEGVVISRWFLRKAIPWEEIEELASRSEAWPSMACALLQAFERIGGTRR
jgi:hypothetical protein